MMKILSLLFCVMLCTCVPALSLLAQGPIDFRININTQQITQSDPGIFKTLERDLVLFLNGTLWTEDNFKPEERIEANLFLTISEVEKEGPDGLAALVPNQYTATVAVQSSRPVFNSGEQTPVFNYQDSKVEFSYQQFEAIQLSQQSFTGNLSNIMAFYVYLILGFDYDTFAPLGGDKFFEEAQELYNRLPSGIQGQEGWVDGKNRNRYSLLKDIRQPRMLPLRRAYYTYHRLGLDLMTTDVQRARNNITLAIEDAKAASQAQLNSVYAQAFVDAKRQEIIEIYKGATAPEQTAVIQTMTRLDPSKSGDYRAIRQAGGTRGSSSTVRPNRTSSIRTSTPFGKQ